MRPSATAPAGLVIIGGWCGVASQAASIRRSAEFATAQSMPLGTLEWSNGHASRGVAGTKIESVLRLGDGRRLRVAIWRKPGGTRQVTMAETLPAFRR